MTIYEFGSTEPPEDQLVRQLLESGEAVPDPSWPYFQIWALSAEVAKQHQLARHLLADAEDLHPEVDEELLQHFQTIREACDRAINLLRKHGNN